MDPTVGALIGVALGSIIGAATTWWQARRQREWQREDFERSLKADRDTEVRQPRRLASPR
ncbi:MAG: hypothetical protein H0U35_10540 [Sporichthyaceae bacterium]|nr:hypothetical protein [Sporichthyaceae bacterium]